MADFLQALFARALRQFRQRLQERFAAGFGLGHEEFNPFGEVAQVGFGDVVLNQLEDEIQVLGGAHRPTPRVGARRPTLPFHHLPQQTPMTTIPIRGILHKSGESPGAYGCITHFVIFVPRIRRHARIAPMPVHGHFRFGGSRPGVYAGLASPIVFVSRISLCHARLRVSSWSQRREARERA